MKQHFRIILVCASFVTIAVILAAMFRYETHNIGGWNTAVYDRWTGTMSYCDTVGCYTQRELKQIAENTAPADPLDAATNNPAQPIEVETPLGTNLEFPAGTDTQTIKEVVNRLEACAKNANSQGEFAKCYRPSVDAQVEGTAYTVRSTGIYDPF